MVFMNELASKKAVPESPIQSCLLFARKISIKQVACHEYKADIAQIARQLSGTTARKQGYVAVFQQL